MPTLLELLEDYAEGREALYDYDRAMTLCNAAANQEHHIRVLQYQKHSLDAILDWIIDTKQVRVAGPNGFSTGRSPDSLQALANAAGVTLTVEDLAKWFQSHPKGVFHHTRQGHTQRRGHHNQLTALRQALCSSHVFIPWHKPLTQCPPYKHRCQRCLRSLRKKARQLDSPA